jgi:putative methyltransferase (TIGR04325 family)
MIRIFSRVLQIFDLILGGLKALFTTSRVPGIIHFRRFYYKTRFFYGSGGYVRFWEAFDTAEAAKKSLGPDCPSSYEDADLTEINRESFMQTHLFDYPVMYWLQKLHGQYDSLIDFGGHIGVKFYAYQNFLPFLKKTDWMVVEVPFAVEWGRREAAERGAANLTFSDCLNGKECDLLFISGAIQYASQPIGELLDSMGSFPRFILLNKAPLHLGPDLYTLENFGSAKIVYRIFNRHNFDEQMHSRGFRKIDTWTIPSRHFTIPCAEEQVKQMEMQGQVWELSK